MRIVYNSYDGRYSDSPRALYEALVGRGAAATHTWIADPARDASFPATVNTVPPGGAAAVAALEAADVVVSNTHLPATWRKRPGARYLQTWHGTPLKRIAGDEPTAPVDGPLAAAQDIARWDALLAPDPTSGRRLAGAFRYSGPVLETGYPRNDVLSSPGAGAVRARVRRELGVPEGTTAVLYTPTWRDDVLDDQGRRDVRLALDLAEFSRRLGDDHVLLLRLHYMVSERLGPLDVPGVLDVSQHPDVSDLYLAADAMVTDYSSTAFDFAVTGKPLLFFTYDLAHYRDDLRGFYVDFEAVAPGPLLSTGSALLDALADLPAATAPYAERYARFRAEHCTWHDGGATERVRAQFLPELTAPTPASVDLSTVRLPETAAAAGAR